MSAVADQELDGPGPLVEVMARLRACCTVHSLWGAGGDAAEVHPAGAVLDPHVVTRPRSNRSRFRPAGPACSTPPGRHARELAIASQPVRLSANSARPARRSTDGQAILDVLPAAGKLGSDLRFCRAPLRNRTVDLLLTMETLCRLS